MSFGYYSSREDLPKVEQILLQKIEEDIGEALHATSYWGYGYRIEFDRLSQLFIRGYYDERRLTYLPDEVCEATEIGLLSIGINKVKKIPQEIGNLQNLYRLFMGNNLIEVVPKSLTELRNVGIVEIQNNRIRQFPEGIENMEYLEDLSLGNNLLQSLPNDIGKAPMLRSIRMPYNNVRKLPDSMRNLKELVRLRYGCNNVKKLPEWFGELSNLRELMLHDNHLSELPDSITDLKYLEVLDLRNNNFEEIPIYQLAELENLQEVYIYGNPISDNFKRKFRAMSRLMPKHIRIDGMSLENYFNKSDQF